MNTDTGEILRMKSLLTDLDVIKEMIEGSGDPEPVGILAGFKQVPYDLTEEAEKVLQGRDRAFADLTQDTPLTRWAKQDRATVNAHRERNKKSMRKASKRRNRK